MNFFLACCWKHRYRSHVGFMIKLNGPGRCITGIQSEVLEFGGQPTLRSDSVVADTFVIGHKDHIRCRSFTDLSGNLMVDRVANNDIAKL